MKGFLHLGSTLVAAYVVWFIVALIANAAGVEYWSSYSWGFLVAALAFFGYWARRVQWKTWWFILPAVVAFGFALWWIADDGFTLD